MKLSQKPNGQGNPNRAVDSRPRRSSRSISRPLDSKFKSKWQVRRQIYSAGIEDQRELPYDRIVVIGPSLGSVISYDLLNAAINWDQVEHDFRFSVVDRTSHLITFGSPLDKTAFLFRSQVNSSRNLREALAARQQPLILNYLQFRPAGRFKWINIYARLDIISGNLDYYDVASEPGYNPVENRIDRQAWKPLLAHTEYWENEELHRALYDAALALTSRALLFPQPG